MFCIRRNSIGTLTHENNCWSTGNDSTYVGMGMHKLYTYYVYIQVLFVYACACAHSDCIAAFFGIPFRMQCIHIWHPERKCGIIYIKLHIFYLGSPLNVLYIYRAIINWTNSDYIYIYRCVHQWWENRDLVLGKHTFWVSFSCKLSLYPRKNCFLESYHCSNRIIEAYIRILHEYPFIARILLNKGF